MNVQDIRMRAFPLQSEEILALEMPAFAARENKRCKPSWDAVSNHYKNTKVTGRAPSPESLKLVNMLTDEGHTLHELAEALGEGRSATSGRLNTLKDRKAVIHTGDGRLTTGVWQRGPKWAEIAEAWNARKPMKPKSVK